MGVTFSFTQLVMDDIMIRHTRKAMTPDFGFDAIGNRASLANIIAEYRNGRIRRPSAPPSVSPVELTREGDIALRAAAIADEIIAGHKVEPLDVHIRNQMKRIIMSAES